MDDQFHFLDTPLHDAVSDGDLDAVRTLIDSGEDVDRLDFMKQTPLIVAASGNSVSVELKRAMASVVDKQAPEPPDSTESIDPLGVMEKIQKALEAAHSQFRMPFGLHAFPRFDPANLTGPLYRRNAGSADDPEPVEET